MSDKESDNEIQAQKKTKQTRRNSTSEGRKAAFAKCQKVRSEYVKQAQEKRLKQEQATEILLKKFGHLLNEDTEKETENQPPVKEEMKHKPKPKIEVEPDTESDDEPVIIKKKPKKSKKKQQYVIYESSSSSSEAEQIVIRRHKKTNNVPPPEPETPIKPVERTHYIQFI